MSETEVILTTRGQWSETQYLRRKGSLYARSVNGGWGGGYDSKNFTPSVAEITEVDLEKQILACGLEDRFDDGETGFIVELGR